MAKIIIIHAVGLLFTAFFVYLALGLIFHVSNTANGNAILLTCRHIGDEVSITYQFTVGENIYLGSGTHSDDKPCADYEAYVSIFYSVDNPEDSRIAQTSSPTGFVLACVFLGVPIILLYLFVVVPIRVIIVFVQGTSQYERLMQTGMIVDGEIHRIRKFRSRLNSTTMLMVNYQFIAPNTDKYIVGKQVKRLDKARHHPLPAQGTPVKVLYADDSAHVML